MKLAVDVGGTAVKYGVSDEEGNFVFTDSFPTPREGLPVFLTCISTICEKAKTVYQVDGAAFSFPGEVHSEEGVIRGISAVEFLHEIPLKQTLSQLMGIPVAMANDAKCAAMGEMWKGAARNYQNAVFVICGTGIGGAVIDNGVLNTGVTKNRGEFGNFPMGAGADGRFTTWSDYTLEKQARKYEKLQPGRASAPHTMNGKMLYQLAKSGDAPAIHLLEEFYHQMALGCITLEFAFDPEIIVIGGGISGNPDIIEHIRMAIQALLHGHRSGFLVPRIAACTEGNQANLYGALYYYLQSYHQQIV